MIRMNLRHYAYNTKKTYREWIRRFLLYSRIKSPRSATPEEIRELFCHVSGIHALMLKLIYAGGMRLTECVRLRIKDLDFDNQTLVIRSGIGDKDRTTLFPTFLYPPLKAHLEEVRALHDKDHANGHGAVYFPEALERKYPGAAREWAWQYAFPAKICPWIREPALSAAITSASRGCSGP